MVVKSSPELAVKKMPEKEKKWSSILYELKKNSPLFVMLLPGLLLLVILNYIPMFGTLIAFKDFKYVGNNFFENFALSKWVGFNNFKFLLQSPDTWTITRNTILYNIVFIVLGNFIAVFFAIGLNEIRNKRTGKIYQSAMLLPYFLSWIIISYLFFGFLSIDKGIINRAILEPLGRQPIEWYSQPKYWPFILVFANILKYAGYNSIVYLATLTGFDETYYEAAVLDGASKWQQITKITIPLLSTVMIILILLGVGRIFNADFGLFYQVPMDSGSLYSTTNVIDTYVYRGLMNNGDIGMSSAAGLYQSVVGFIMVLTANLVVRKIDKEKALF